jgi:uncharacterized protein YvpB
MTQLLEIQGEGWEAARNQGTRVQAGWLQLDPAAVRGQCEVSLGESAAGFDRLVLSLNVRGWDPGCRVSTRVRLLLDTGRWTAWAPVGVYGAAESLPVSEPFRDDDVHVATDEVRALSSPATAAEVRLELEAPAPPGATGATPRVWRVAASTWRADDPPAPAEGPHPAWGRVLDVPTRSQLTEHESIAHRICSPTSLSMVLEYHGHDLVTPEVAGQVFDRAGDIYGNWSFNVAFASELGLEATAAHLPGLRALEDEIAAGRPVVISHRYAAGELSDTPVRATVGHLIVVVGFTAQGDVVVNDPAADPRAGEEIRRVYRRAEIERTWHVNAAGVAYVLRPRRPQQGR